MTSCQNTHRGHTSRVMITSQSPTRLRSIARTNLLKILGPDMDKLSKKIEITLYNWSLQICDDNKMPRAWHEFFEKTYKNKLRTLLYNLKNSQDSKLCDAVKCGDVEPSTLITMTAEQMQPHIWAAAKEELERKNHEKFAPCLQDMIIGSGAFVCKRCRSDKTAYIELQTRSTDEPSTIYVKCLECEATWKFT